MGRDIRNYQTMLNTNMGEQDKLNALLQQKMSELDEREACNQRSCTGYDERTERKRYRIC